MLLWLGLETQTWKFKEMTQKGEHHLEQDIIVITQDQNGKPDTGLVINGELAPR